MAQSSGMGGKRVQQWVLLRHSHFHRQVDQHLLEKSSGLHTLEIETGIDYTITKKSLPIPKSWVELLTKDHPLLTFDICHCKTFFTYIVGENSPILLKRNCYTMYTVGKQITHDFYMVKLFLGALWLKIHPWLKLSWCWLFDDFLKVIFHQHNWFLVNTWTKEMLIKSWNFIAVAQRLKELWSFRWMCR